MYKTALSCLVALLSAESTLAFSRASSGRTLISSRLFSSNPTTLPEGIVKQISTPGKGKGVDLGDIATVKYSCYLADEEKTMPFARSEKQKMVSSKVSRNSQNKVEEIVILTCLSGCWRGDYGRGLGQGTPDHDSWRTIYYSCH